MNCLDKIPYNELSLKDKELIIIGYYNYKNLSFTELSNLLNVSERAISRVLKDNNINTKRINRYRLNENFFRVIDNEQKAYILGLLYADGYIGNEKFNNIVLSLKDKELVEEVAKCLEYDGDIRRTKKGGFENSKENYVLNFSSITMADHLRRLGLHPNKSLKLGELPEINRDFLRHFVRGYFDGDGSIILTRHTSYHKMAGKIKKYEYPSYRFAMLSTKEFLINIANIMGIHHYKIRDTKTFEIKELSVSAKCEFMFIYKYLYDNANIYLKRKHNKWLDIMSAFMK